MRRSCTALTAAGVLTTCLTVAAPAAGAGAGVQWGHARAFSGDEPHLVVDGTGTVTMAWMRHGQVKAARHAPGRAWTRPVTISDGFPEDLVVDGKGTITAAVRGFDGRLTTASRPAGGRWSDPHLLSGPQKEGDDWYVGVFEVALATNEDGDLAAVWSFGSEDMGPGARVWSAYRPAGGAWLPNVRLAGPERGGFEVSAGMDAAGAVTAAWDGPGPMVAHRTPIKGWGRVVRLARRATSPPEVVVGTGGNAWVGWTGGSDRSEGTPVLVAERPAGEHWLVPARLTHRDTRAQLPQLAVDGSGRVVAAWTVRGGRVVAATRPIGGPWNDPRLVEDVHGGGPGDLALAVAPSGQALLAWTLWSNDNHVDIACRPAGGPWGEPRRVGAAGVHSATPTLAVGGGVAALAYYVPGLRVQVGTLPRK